MGSDKEQNRSAVRRLLPVALLLAFLLLAVWFGAGLSFGGPEFPAPPSLRVTLAPTPKRPLQGTLLQLEPKVASLRFFEMNAEGKKEYKIRFLQSQTRYVEWELCLEHLAPSQRIDFSVDYILKRSDGSTFSQGSSEWHIESSSSSSCHRHGIGWADPGLWETGRYTLEIYAGAQLLDTQAFEITSNP